MGSVEIYKNYNKPNQKLLSVLLKNKLFGETSLFKELTTIYRISQIILESVIQQYEPKDFLSKISEEIEDVLPEFCSSGIYVYNNFNEEYQLVVYKDEKTVWIKDIFEQNDEVVKTIFALDENVIQNNKVYTYLLKENEINSGFIICIVGPQNILSQQSKDLLLSVSNLISVSIRSLKFLQEEKEKIKITKC